MAESEKKQCANCKAEFVIDSDDFSFYEKINVPPPTFCPNCRSQRRLLFRNERNFYKRTCGLCGKSIISVYPDGASFPVYCQKCWWGDGWDPFSYGRDFDFSRPFSEQFKELSERVPALSIMNDDTIASVNCEYAYDFAFSKNCYLTVCGWYVENGLYTYYVNHSKDIADSWFVLKSEFSHELVNCEYCFGCRYCDFCDNCRDCTLSTDLKNCSNCVMCIGLRNKQYCILNKQYTKEEYQKEVEKMMLGERDSFERYKNEFMEFSLKFPRRYAVLKKCVDSTGDMLINSKMSKYCFYADNVENGKYVLGNDGSKDCYDINNTGKPTLCYESVTPDESAGNIATLFCWKDTNVMYSNNCHGSNDLIGCSGVKKGAYVILNKKYSKEEFFSLKSKIVDHMKKTGEWGEFFPYSICPFAYNETAAQEFFPLEKEEAIAKGYRWKDREERGYTITKRRDDLPVSISKTEESICNEVIGCDHSGKCNHQCTTAFRITPAEFQLYKKLDIPIPFLCPNCRHYERLKRRNLPKLYHRICQCIGVKSNNGVYQNTATHEHGDKPCPNEFETSYSPESPAIVYCEQCYQKEIV